MERIKTRIIIAVAERLGAAPDTNTKTELIEELSENLYERYLDLIGSGVDEETAYNRAMEDLGDVNELLDYLDDMGEGNAHDQNHQESRDHFAGFMRGLEDVIRETVNQTKDAAEQAKIIAKDLGRKFQEKYPDGFEGNFHVHYDGKDDDHGEHPEGTEEACEDKSNRTRSFSIGYDKAKGGFFWESTGRGRPVSDPTTITMENVEKIDIQITNGDVTFSESSDDTVQVTSDSEELEILLSDEHVLTIRQGKTATSSVIFGRGLASADVEVALPAKVWDSIRAITVNGDIMLEMPLEARELVLQTVSGDVELDDAVAETLQVKTVSGDVRGTNMRGDMKVTSVSGDIDLNGSFNRLAANTTSGDVTVDGQAESLACSSLSGDMTVTLSTLPREMTVTTKSGDCTVSIPGGQGFTLEFSGELESGFELVGPIGRRSGSAIYLDGGDRTFRVSSLSGDISLEKC